MGIKSILSGFTVRAVVVTVGIIIIDRQFDLSGVALRTVGLTPKRG